MTTPSPFIVRDLLGECFWPMLTPDNRWLQMSSASNEYAQKARRVLAVLLVDHCGMTVEEAATFTGRQRRGSRMAEWIADAKADKEIAGMAEAVARVVKERQGCTDVGSFKDAG